jgi:hypothetical protein
MVCKTGTVLTRVAVHQRCENILHIGLEIHTSYAGKSICHVRVERLWKEFCGKKAGMSSWELKWYVVLIILVRQIQCRLSSL